MRGEEATYGNCPCLPSTRLSPLISPRGGELLTKLEWMLLKCRENVYAPNPFLSFLSVRNAVESASTFFSEKLDDFHFALEWRALGNMPVLICSGFPPFNPARNVLVRGFLLSPSGWKWIISPDLKVENHYLYSCSFITTEANNLRHCQYPGALSWSYANAKWRNLASWALQIIMWEKLCKTFF